MLILSYVKYSSTTAVVDIISYIHHENVVIIAPFTLINYNAYIFFISGFEEC